MCETMPDTLEDVEKNSMAERLRSLHEGESRLSFARRIGVSDSTLGNYERGSRVPDADFLVRLRERVGVDLNWLITGQAGAMQSPAAEFNLAVLPRYDVRASAGAGSLVVSEDVSEYFSVGRDWLRRNLPPWAPTNATVGVLENGGDSMEPTIRDGDLLMVVQDVEWRTVERGGIFVFSLDDHRLLLKRLQVMTNGDLRIISDNPAYAAETIPFDRIEHRIRIHGQVFFAGGRPR